MGNIIDYVKNYNNITFDKKSFNEIDSLVLSQFIYLKFENIKDMINNEIKIADLFKYIEIITKKTRNEKNNIKLLSLMSKGNRYKNIILSDICPIIDFKNEQQYFSAVFKLNKNIYYIAYRGTDSSLVGWKEDYNISFMKNIPSQISALNYFEKIANKYKNVTFYLGGHSKGANIAVYAGIYAKKELKNKILKIYDHDGPGFLSEVLSSKEFEDIEFKIEKTVPKTAIIGLLFEQHSSYTVIDSSGFLMFQHDPYNWKIENNNFIKLKNVDRLSQYTNKTLHKWLLSTDIKTRELFINSLYDIIYQDNIYSFSELWSNLNNYKIILNKIKNLDPKIKNLIKETLKELIFISKEEAKSYFKDIIK